MKNSEKNFLQLLETVHEGIWYIDSAFTITYANKHITHMLGYPPKEQKGKSVFDFIDAEAGAFLRKKVKDYPGDSPEQHECKVMIVKLREHT